MISTDIWYQIKTIDFKTFFTTAEVTIVIVEKLSNYKAGIRISLNRCSDCFFFT